MRWLSLLTLVSLLSRTKGFQSPWLTRDTKRYHWYYDNHVKEGYDLKILRMTSSDGEQQSVSSFCLPNRSRRTQHRDVVIVGGGLAGLSTALYLSQVDPDRHITILEKEEHNVEAKKKTTISSFAAAGMLAPQSERLPRGSLLDLCLASRRMYPEYCDMVESMAKEAGDDGARYLYDKNPDSNLDPWSVGYVASGGFLAPAFAGDSVATWAPPEDSGSATWLDEIQVRELEPNLHPDVVGGWWFPEDASVDARRLTCSLHAACVAAGVQFCCGKLYEATSLDLNNGKCHGIWLRNGRYLKAKSILVANGAWMRNLLPVPIEPHKGQSLSLKMPKDRPPILRRVLFAQDSYIVPKADGNIVIGATVEAGSFDGNVTPAGLLHILTHALRLVPGLKDLPIAETWAGLRPTTPDKGPILGKSPWENLYLAGGYWRNGVLLAPKTAQLLACLMTNTTLSAKDEKLLAAFSWDRFTAKGGGAALAANARYAASMHPVHSRTSGTGVAAAVGTELGSYSTARVARDERKKERSSLWRDSSDDAFERAAALGRKDASTFTLGDDDVDKTTIIEKIGASNPSPVFFPDATKSAATPIKDKPASTTDKKGDNISSLYETIKENKARQSASPTKDPSSADRPDPGFRIHHVDSETGEWREVPPYTAPGDFLKSLGNKSTSSKPNAPKVAILNRTKSNADESTYHEKTYDGYQAIQEANGRMSRSEELEAMKRARMKNRLGQELIDESEIGANKMEVSVGAEESRDGAPRASSTTDVAAAYQTILDNKAKKKPYLPNSSSTDDGRPDPGFRIFHMDAETGKAREVPPYTSPGEFLDSIRDTDEADDDGNDNESSGSVISSDGINGHSIEPHEPGMPQTHAINGEKIKNQSEHYSETTYDGYQAILEANSGTTREEELESMRKARQKNRIGQSGIDEAKLN